jgi:uncharacterized membrane protein
VTPIVYYNEGATEKTIMNRSINKTVTFAIVHFTVAFAVGYLMTGSVMVGGAIALVEPMVNTIAYHVHELAWKRREKPNVNGGQAITA